MICKYIILKEKNRLILFTRDIITHEQVAKNLGEVISAGFCYINVTNRKIKVKCFGNSSTLQIQCNPNND